MLIGLCADLHFRGEDYHYASDALNEALTGMGNRGVQLVLCSGDVFDSASIADKHAMTGTLIRAFLDPVESHRIPWLIVEGNHDQAPASERGALSAVSSSPYCTVVSDGWVSTHHREGVSVACLPWIDKASVLASLCPEDRKHHQDAFQDYCRNAVQSFSSGWAPGSYKILIGHCEVVGARGGPFRYVIPGSTFWFPADVLADTGADLIALGHVHQRQSFYETDSRWCGYIGALRQLNYGERHNPTGWMFLDTDTGHKEFVEISSPPKYFKVDASEALTEAFSRQVRPIDKVLVTGSQRPESLPKEWDFQVDKVSTVTYQSRTGDLSPDTPIESLLGEWLAANNEDAHVDLLMPYVQRLCQKSTGETSSFGCLEEVLRIRIQGLARHQDSTFDTAGKARVAVVGKNGLGKSTLIGAVYACFYGVWPMSARGTIYDTMTGNTAELEVVFRANGKTYRAHRIMSKKGGKTEPPVALLTEITMNGKERPIAGPKAGPFEDKIEQIIGPKDLVLGCIFYSQDGTGDLINSKKGIRKDWIRKFLGLQEYDYRAKAAADAAKTAEKRLLQLDILVDSFVSVDNNVRDLEASLAPYPSELAGLDSEIEAIQSALADYRSQVGTLIQQHATRNQLIQVLDHEMAEIRKGEEKIARLEEELASIMDASGQGQALADQDMSERLQQEMKRASEEVKHFYARLEESSRRNDAILLLRQSVSVLRQEIASCTSRASMLDSVGCSDNLLPCPLIRDALAAKDRISPLTEELSQAEAKLAAAVAESGEAVGSATGRNVETKLAEIQRLISYKEKYDRLSQLQASHVSDLKEHIDRKNSIQEQVSALPPDTGAHAALQSRIDAAEKMLRSKQSERAEKAQSKAVLEARLEMFQRERQQAIEAMEEAIPLQTDVWVYGLLARAFGRDGLPQLLISSALPAIQKHLDEICQVDFDGRYLVRFETQKTHKKGTSEESFEILFSTDGTTWYDIASGSGGEIAAVRGILRTGLGLYQASRARGHRVVFLDELTAHQDEVNTESTMRMMDRIQERFSQVFFVTFDNTLLTRFPDRIVLEPNGRYKWVSVGHIG